GEEARERAGGRADRFAGHRPRRRGSPPEDAPDERGEEDVEAGELTPHEVERGARHRRRGGRRDARDVDPLDDPRDVDPVEDLIDVDAVDDPPDVDPVDDLPDVDPLDDAIDVDAVDDPGDVDASQDDVQVDA